jgi:starch synthase (maltosyl-transferring)
MPISHGTHNDRSRQRVAIENVSPHVDDGRYPIKRVVGDTVLVSARVFADGHDLINAVVKYRHQHETQWHEARLSDLGNDQWEGEFCVSTLGRYLYTVEGWADAFATWQRDLVKRVAADQDVAVDLMIGAELVEAALARVSAGDRSWLEPMHQALSNALDRAEQIRVATSDDLAELMLKYSDRRFAVRYDRELAVVVDRQKARYGTWYELFPRSCAVEPGRHGTLRDCEARLPYVASMGFDVLYLPPIHPIGRQYRKGKNNAVRAEPGDVGCPWAIGAAEGGHKAVLPELGTLEDFRRLVAKAAEHGLEIALDIALQCAPDHPYIAEHPDWFRKRPDGTIQYAENPPKKYQDIYPFDFESESWRSLWEELKDIFAFWAKEGVRIFRVDNPHTKAFAFWEWLIAEVKAEYPDAIFLAEAFTRPAVMHRLAKVGFTQSYTYFTWRNTKTELTEYFTQLTQSPVREFFRPNLWPNTPDILNEFLQFGGRPAFMARYVLAATLGASCGIYGPTFELCVAQAREPGSEEYLDSEKYQLRHWQLDAPESLAPFIARVNQIRREQTALQSDRGLRFHAIDNEQLICYSKRTPDLTNVIVTVVNLDPHHTQAGWLELPLAELGVDERYSFQAHDLLGEGRYLWNGPRNFVELNPAVSPAHIFRLRRRVRSESQFEYFL